MKLCVTRKLKQCHAPLAAAKSMALFNGTIHLPNFLFPQIMRADLNTIISYMNLATVSIMKYCNQYGVNKLIVDVNPVSTHLIGAKIYNDSELRTWIDEIGTEANIPVGDCIITLNSADKGVINTDADPKQGIGGYHGTTGKYRYCFVNVTGSNWTVDDRADNYAHVLSHELAEMCVDPNADLGNPEVSDPCNSNVGLNWRDYFDADGKYIASSQQWPPPFPYTYFIAPIVKPGYPSDKPAPDSACNYYPNSSQSPTSIGTGILNLFTRTLKRKG